MTPVVRRATVDDVDELMRLRIVLRVTSGDPAPLPGEWEAQAESDFRERLPEVDGDLAAFVVDGPDSRLLAAAVGIVQALPAMPHRPDGRRGWISDVVTEPGHRRHGLGTAVMSDLVAWFRSRGVSEVQLSASTDGAPLYESLGFVRSPDALYALRFTPSGPPD